MDALGSVTPGALDLHVAGVPDEHDVHVALRHAHGLDVDLRHERAGGVDHAQAACVRALAHRGRHAMRAEDEERALRHVRRIVDEDRALGAQALHDVPVVDDLVAHVDRRVRSFSSASSTMLDGAVDAGAEAARMREQDIHGGEG